MPATAHETDVLLRVRGTVQGVGFRPFVHRMAADLGLRGWVLNDAEGVLIRAAGDPDQIARLTRALEESAPPAAAVASVTRLEATDELPPVGGEFVIVASTRRPGAVRTTTPPDLALCADCRRELLDPADRRHRYAFINCTQCGPRYSVVESLPYDRPNTTMRAFAQCRTCQREYDDPLSRRFHAEPNACPECGPQVTLRDHLGRRLGGGDVAIRSVARLLRAGLLCAVKGVGGYHLCCDATNAEAVAALRERKHRDEKPFAVMFRDLAQLRAQAEVSPAAAQLLQSPAAPIVLVPRRPDSCLAAGVAPGNPWLGALLPYSPLHVLLLQEIEFPIVATSANLSDEPICTDEAVVRERLAGIADVFLDHDRPIARPVDDSVVRLTAGDEPILLRRARGHAPGTFALPQELPDSILCVGGQMKNTIALAAGRQVVVSPHLGDLENLLTHDAFVQAIQTLGATYGSAYRTVLHDLHPDYSSTHFAQRLGLATIPVQHHLAHVLACLLENNHPAHGVLGVAWDGTGYGEDGTVWGGEFLLLRHHQAERFARLRPFRLPGGEAAVRDARRVALGLAYEVGAFERIADRLGFGGADASLLDSMIARRVNSPVCSSAGRLFDGLAALLGLGRRNHFEGQLPLLLEAAAGQAACAGEALPFPVLPSSTHGARFEVDWRPAVDAVVPPAIDAAPRAAAFHRGLARAVVDVARRSGAPTVALTGGCFQNALLHSLVRAELEAAGFRVLVHRRLSPNDNSISAGQALAALLNLTRVHCPN